MPSPAPIKRQLVRSLGVPCKRRGYQARGAEIVRPSARSTVNASSVTAISSALTVPISRLEIFIPTSQQKLLVFFDQSLDPHDLTTAEALTVLESNRLQPELCDLVLAFHMDVRRLVPISCIEEKPVRSRTKNGRHRGLSSREV